MGNNIGGRKKAKVMKINGEILKLKTPIRVWDVIKDYPGHVLLDSEAVKHFGVRAKPLEPQQELKPTKIYFLLELPKFPEENKVTRRVRSGIHMSAKDRLECLMLSRRSVSDIVPSSGLVADGPSGPSSGPMRLKVRLPRAQVAKLVEKSRDKVEVAEKIIDLYLENGGGDSGSGDATFQREDQLRPSRGCIKEHHQASEKRVSFVPTKEEEIHEVDKASL